MAVSFSKALMPLYRRIRLLVGRGVLKLVDDTKKAQEVQVQLLAGELRTAERWQDYGLVSVPKADAEALYLSVGGDRSHGLVVCVMDRDKRPVGVLQPGDVGLYEETNGVRVRLEEATGIVHIAAASDFVALATPTDEAIAQLKGWIDAIVSAIQGGVPAPQDGGAALQASIAAALPVTSDPASTAATKTKAE